MWLLVWHYCFLREGFHWVWCFSTLGQVASLLSPKFLFLGVPRGLERERASCCWGGWHRCALFLSCLLISGLAAAARGVALIGRGPWLCGIRSVILVVCWGLLWQDTCLLTYLLDLLSSSFMLLSKFDFRLFLLRVRLSFRLFLTRRRQLMAKPVIESGAKMASRIRLR